MLFAFCLALLMADPEVEGVSFNRDVRPILSDNCFACHGPDERHRQADLRLDERQSALQTGAIVPGDPDASALIQRVTSVDPEERMPPAKSHKSLSKSQIDLLRRWVAQGAPYQQHWSFQPLVRPAAPIAGHPIDYFVHRQLAAVGLSSSPTADRRTLIRRLYFDLLGLPPEPKDVADFLGDNSDDAYMRLVDRLLASPRFGERMAIAWLDVVRYADTIGYHSDNPRNVWPYRDWVIASFNRNLPFDQFTVQQLAGDLVEGADQETRVGSAFNRLLLSTEEGGAQPKDYEARMLTDRVRAVGAAWLGLTTGCAQCHDHKFDPFTTRDFYALGAFFADIKEPIVGRREDGIPVCPEALRGEQAELQAAVESARTALRECPTDDELLGRLKQTEKALKLFNDSLPRCLVSESADRRRTVRVLPRGNFMDDSGEIVQPALPGFFAPGGRPPASSSERNLTRLDLARWLVARDNPLTARTVMNRLWKQFFGTGLSRVLDDLGAQGQPPTHPELLDWLACEFIDGGWDMKRMVRWIVSSETYRQSSRGEPHLLSADPQNRYLARQSAFRLDAEIVRDNALKVAGLLEMQFGGPAVKPYQPDGYWENLNFPPREYQAERGEQQYRRGVYIWWQRTFLHPSLLAFDAPSREECAADRTRSNLPQQALVLLNDPTYVEASRCLAARILLCAQANTHDRTEWAWQEVLQRTPTTEEMQTIKELVDLHHSTYANDARSARELTSIGIAPPPSGLDAQELAVWTHVARVLLNLHETITRN